MIRDHFPTVHALWRRAGGLPRRIAAALLTCLGLTLVLLPHHDRPTGAEQPVVVAARAVPAGVVVRAADVRVARWPTSDIAETAIRDPPAVIGRSLSSPAGAGELLTTTKLLGTAITSRLQRGQSAITVTLRGAAQLAVVSSGARIDLYAAGGSGTDDPPAGGETAVSPSASTPVASDVDVISVLGEPTASGGQLGAGSASIIIGCDQATAARIAESGAEFVAALRP